MSVEAMSASMTEMEFGAWWIYAQTKQLPTRRFELYFAQISLLIARQLGVENVTLRDFLFDVDDGIEEE